MSTTTQEKISERLKAVIEQETPEKGRPAKLEAITGVASETWRKFLSEKQKATVKMVEACSQQWPQYAFWISTGITDNTFGHLQPSTLSDYPERKQRQQISRALFLEAINECNNTDRIAMEVGTEKVIHIELQRPHKELPHQISDKAVLLTDIRWMHIFLDEMLMEFSIDTMINMYNEARSKAKALESYAKELNAEQEMKLLLAKFETKKADIEKLAAKIDQKIRQRNGNNEG